MAERPTKRICITQTLRIWAVVDAEDAEAFLPTLNDDGTILEYGDSTNTAEEWARLTRLIHHDVTFFDGDVDSQEVPDDEPGDWVGVIDGTQVGGYVWSARYHLMRAAQDLSSGRYIEGDVSELDSAQRAIHDLEERLRLMGLAIDEKRRAAAVNPPCDDEDCMRACASSLLSPIRPRVATCRHGHRYTLDDLFPKEPTDA